MVQSKLNLRARRTLELVLTRNGHLVKSELILTPHDVHAGPGAAFEIVHPDAAQPFRMFEAAHGDFVRLWVLPVMEGLIYLRKNGVVSVKQHIRTANMQMSRTGTIPIDIRDACAGRLKCGDYGINFALRETAVSADGPDRKPQFDLPFRDTDPPPAVPPLKLPAAPGHTVKALRVALLVGNRLRHERVFRDRQPVIVGPSRSLRIDRTYIPLQFTLFSVERGAYYFRFFDFWPGQVVRGDNAQPQTLAELVRGGAEHIAVGIYCLRLTPEHRGLVKIGDTTVLFNFVVPTQKDGE